MNSYVIVAYIVVFLLGALLGVGELVSRYDKVTVRTIFTPTFIIYVLLNALLSLFALLLIREFRFDFGVDPQFATNPSLDLILLQSLLAVFGTAAFLRSSLFVIQVRNQDVELGPSGFLRVLRMSVDRVIDRNRTMERARLIEDLMTGVSFERAHQSLPMYCLTLSGKQLSPEEQESLGNEIAELRTSKLSDANKSRLLGLILVNSVGEDILEASVRGIEDEIKPSSASVFSSSLEKKNG
jgi:hypothetical protein